jgi:uncharacterized SAM-binding protein YcdF (DUF218 family)
MFFTLSKVLWLIAAPSNFICLIIVSGLFAVMARKYRQAGILIAVVGATALLACGLGPVGFWLVRPLEDRFARPSTLSSPKGIIVLGGAISPEMFQSRSALILHGARLTESIALAHRFPGAPVIFVGGTSSFFSDAVPESAIAQKFFSEAGLSSDLVIYESRSRNTFENAEFSSALLKPKPEEKWILVTSASHMPRAVGVFRHFGFDVIPWPADYESLGTAGELSGLTSSVSSGLSVCDLAVKEWIGLVAYRISGRIDELLPK